MAATIALTDLIFDEKLYPRQNVDDHHIGQMMRAMEAGIVLPPIVVDKKTKRIVDGVHRYHAHLRRNLKRIDCILKSYASDAELFKEAVMLNSGIGLKLGIADSLKCMDIAEKIGLKEIDLAAALRTSIAHLRTIKPRFGTIEDAIKGVKQLRKIPLKGSVRHLAGQKLSKEQVDAMETAPGQSYLLSIRQLIDALEHNLLPPNHPALWTELTRLEKLIEEAIRERSAAA